MGALPEYFNNWLDEYPTSAAADAGCNVCHSSGGGDGWNRYGWDIREEFIRTGRIDMIAAILSNAVEQGDSDMDFTGASNALEILQGTQPGWTVGLNNDFYFKDGSIVGGNSAPAQVLDDLDPPVIAVTPTILDFGSFDLNQTAAVNAQVVIENLGQQMLVLNNTEVCGSTGSEYSVPDLQNTEITAGNNVSWTITYTPDGEAVDSGCVKIDSSAAANSEIEVAVTGHGCDGLDVQLDIDIEALVVPDSVRIGDPDIPVTVQLQSTCSEPETGVMLVVQNNQSYDEHVLFDFMALAGTQIVALPHLATEGLVEGELMWTADLTDQNPDSDLVAVTTNVQAPAPADTFCVVIPIPGSGTVSFCL